MGSLLSFERPIGTGADVSELEYATALMQTGMKSNLRLDCSLTAKDIALFLVSRHGVNISEEEVETYLLKDFGTEGKLDLMEFVTLLLIPSLRLSDNEELFKYIISMIIHDSLDKEHSEDEKAAIELTKDTLRSVFVSLGEDGIAADDELLESMITAASADGSETAPVLDAATFARALTHDLDAYDSNNPSEVRTNFCDIMEADTVAKPDATKDDIEGNKGGQDYKINLEKTLPHLDLTADTVRSRSLVVASWVSFVMSFFTYYSGVGTFAVLPSCQAFEFQSEVGENTAAFLCTVGWSIGRWLYIVIVMAFYGIVYFGTTNVGNGIETTNPLLPLAGTVAAAAFTYIPPYITAFDHQDQIVDRILKSICVVLGSIVVVINAWQTLAMFSAYCCAKKKWLIPSSIKSEALLKQAAVKKTNRMVESAHALHTTDGSNTAVKSNLGQALFNFAKYGSAKTETVGGFRWTWDRIRNNELFEQEGMWFSNRLISINVTQFVLSVFILLLGIAGTILIYENYEPPDTPFEVVLNQIFNIDIDLDRVREITEDVSRVVSAFLVEDTPVENFGCPTLDQAVDCSGFNSLADCVANRGTSWLCTAVDYTMENGAGASSTVQQGLLQGAGLDLSSVNDSTLRNLLQASQAAIDSLYPTERYMLVAPFLLGTLIAFATALCISFATLPSIATTTLKLRSGAMEFLYSPRNYGLRKAPDKATILQGSMFWSILFSAGLMGFVFAFLLFLILWQSTSAVAQRVIALLVGLIIVILIQLVSFLLCRIFTSVTYYRKRPKATNILLLTRECAYFALTIFTALVRGAKLVLITIFFVGRVDVPFLAPGIAEFRGLGVYIDNLPQVFLMDILQHEAHRHPFIETVGVMCLLKLKHGRQFASKAGCTWRLLFVLLLMPWLTKYRTLARPNMRQKEDGITYMKEGGENQEDAAEEMDSFPAANQTTGMSNVDTDESQEVRALKREVQLLKEQLMVSRTTEQNLRRRSSHGLASLVQSGSGMQFEV